MLFLWIEHKYENTFAKNFKTVGYYRLYTDFQLPFLEIFCEEMDVEINIYFGYILLDVVYLVRFYLFNEHITIVARLGVRGAIHPRPHSSSKQDV